MRSLLCFARNDLVHENLLVWHQMLLVYKKPGYAELLLLVRTIVKQLFPRLEQGYRATAAKNNFDLRFTHAA